MKLIIELLLSRNCLFALTWAFHTLTNVDPQKLELTSISLAPTPDGPKLLHGGGGRQQNQILPTCLPLVICPLWPVQALRKAHSLERLANILKHPSSADRNLFTEKGAGGAFAVLGFLDWELYLEACPTDHHG